MVDTFGARERKRASRAGESAAKSPGAAAIEPMNPFEPDVHPLVTERAQP